MISDFTSQLVRRSAFALLLVSILSSPGKASTFEFSFDNNPDDQTVADPFVGTGSMSFNETLSDGTYPLLDLTDLEINFQFGSDVFKNVDIVTPLDEVLVVISDNGQSLNFSNVNGYGSGQFIGSIDFINPQNQSTLGLSTEPPDFGGNLDLYLTVDATGYPQYFGNYGATLVPEPYTATMAFLAMLPLVSYLRRRNLS
ncbi:MAG: hypothetical protein AAF497_00265 [Planctomycetota bacterium]